MTLALVSCERESAIKVDMNIAYDSNALKHHRIATTRSREPFPKQRSGRTGFSMTCQITAMTICSLLPLLTPNGNNYMLTSSPASIVPGESEGLTNLERRKEPLPITGKESAMEPQWKEAPTPIPMGT